MDEAQKFELESTVEELEGYRGRHTELITVLVPAGATLTQTTKQLEDEKGTATNIKSTATRKNVINSLERAIRKLKEIGRTPKNGLAVYAGNVTMADGKESLEVWAIEPPKPLKVKIYRCDQTFIVDPL
ncbi:peptide chain release factor 1, partial [archaeon]|nr:peptide chain release factor 1 [archaeon]